MQNNARFCLFPSESAPWFVAPARDQREGLWWHSGCSCDLLSSASGLELCSWRWAILTNKTPINRRAQGHLFCGQGGAQAERQGHVGIVGITWWHARHPGKHTLPQIPVKGFNLASVFLWRRLRHMLRFMGYTQDIEDSVTVPLLQMRNAFL